MRYFRLLDDVHVPKRWHLGEAYDRSTKEPLVLTEGKPIRGAPQALVLITNDGIPLDFCLTSFSAPIATKKLGDKISSIATSEVQRFTVNFQDNDYSSFEALNATRVIKCLDEKRSRFTKWTKADNRPDRIGQYRMVTELKIDTTMFTPDVHFFRIDGWSIVLIVSEQIKIAMEATGCLGAKFQEVT